MKVRRLTSKEQNTLVKNRALVPVLGQDSSWYLYSDTLDAYFPAGDEPHAGIGAMLKGSWIFGEVDL